MCLNLEMIHPFSILVCLQHSIKVFDIMSPRGKNKLINCVNETAKQDQPTRNQDNTFCNKPVYRINLR